MQLSVAATIRLAPTINEIVAVADPWPLYVDDKIRQNV